MGQGGVAAFAPSRNGLHFGNAFPHAALASLTLPVLGSITLGDAANGVCGGMAFTVRDLFEAGILPGPETDPPAAGTPRFEYLARRLVDSFDLPAGPFRYLALMEPLLPDGGGLLGALIHGRAWVMIKQEWPAIRGEIDAGRLCPLGLIRVLSADPRDLGRNHQVVAYRYALDGSRLTIGVYDPNHPDDDGVEISLDISNPMAETPVDYSPNDGPVFCFFRSGYAPSQPTPWVPGAAAAAAASDAGVTGPAGAVG